MKLLNKSIGLYIVYATVVLLVSIPVLYFAIRHRVVHEMDESLAEQKANLINKLQQADTASLSPWLQNIQPDITLTPSTENYSGTERFYTVIAYDTVSRENSPYRVTASAIRLNNKPYILQIKNSLLDTNELIGSIVKIVAMLLLLIITGLILINQLLSKKLWKPFYSTINTLSNFKIEKNEPVYFDKTSITEFTDLNNAIEVLINRNKEVYKSQKEFTENAAHEMQTPLAIIQAKLDLLMQTDPLNKEQSELIGDLSDVNQRMKRLHSTLLLLTKIENNQFPETEPVSVKNVLEKLIAQYTFKAMQKNITIRHEPEPDIAITANKMLIEIMLGNLLNNAIKHNADNGHVMIAVTGKQLSVINSSNAIPLSGEKMFERFHKQTADSNSLGLGLQIAKKIADNYQYTIHYQFKDAQHCFVVTFI